MKKLILTLLAMVVTFTIGGCSSKQNPSSDTVGKTDYSVEQVAKKSTQPTSYTTMIDVPMGTQFTCYPQAPYAFIIRENTPEGIVDINVNITSFTAELTEKNVFSGVFENNSQYNPFVTTVTIKGYVDLSQAGRELTIVYRTDVLGGEYMARGTVDSNGNFEVVENQYWYKPVSIWLNSAFMYWAH